MKHGPASGKGPRSSLTVEAGIAAVLRAGVLVGAFLIALGMVGLVRTGRVHGGRVSTHPLVLVRDAWRGRPYAVVELGLLVLIATPVCRVALSIVYFAVERDWLYVLITLVVLGVLIVGFYLGGI